MWKKTKGLFLIPMCLALLTGCSNIDIRYYQSSESSSIPNPTQNNTQNIEDFFEDSATTYTENITSKTLETLYETCKKSTVTIETYVTYTRQGVSTTTSLYSSGSGFIAKESENYLYIYTNAHVTSVSSSMSISISIEVILSDYTRYSGTVIASDGDEDVSIVRIDKPKEDNYLVAALADSSEVKVGESVFAIGSPLGLSYASTLTSGVVSGVDVAKETDDNEDGNTTTMYLIQTDTAINPGNSGGPLFNYNGEVIGVNTLKIFQSDSKVDVEGMGFAIPINHFNLVAETIMDGGTYTRPQIGVTYKNVSSMSLSEREKYGINVQNGLYISSVTNSSSNLVRNTIITNVNDNAIYTLSDFAKELYSYNVGDTIQVTYCDLDGNNSTTVTVTLI
jgi:serine protease Do